MLTKKFIDIRKILKEKSPRFYLILPSFITNWLAKKLHEDELNKGMEYLSQFNGLEHNSEILNYLKVKVDVTHPENIQVNGGAYFVSNHPLGGLDGMALIKAIGEKRKDIRFLVNDILKNLKNYGDIFVGVNKTGPLTREAIKVIEDVYSSESAVLVFPAGLVSRKLKQGIEDLEWNKSFITKALKYNKPIIPVYIQGQNSDLFYSAALWRKRLGIKANLEMLMLPDEMFKQQNRTIHLHFGKAINPEIFTSKYSEKEWASKIRAYVYSGDIKRGVAFKPS